MSGWGFKGGCMVLAVGVCATSLATTAFAMPEDSAAAPPSVGQSVAPGTPLATATRSAQAKCVKQAKPVTKKQAKGVAKIARKKLLRASRTTGRDQFPSGAHSGETAFRLTSRFAWTSGFFPAQQWLMYRQASSKKSQKKWRKQARKATSGLLPLSTYTGSHDIGFMVGLPLGLAKSLDPKPRKRAQYTATYRQSAQSLATRWNENVGAIQSDTYEGEWGLIIDSAVNEAFLIEAGQEIGGPTGATLVDRGTRHMKTLIEHFVRPDGSTVHRLKFDRVTGSLIGSTPGQGQSAESTWSRGQAWAILGFARAYKATGDPEILDAAAKVADFWLRQLPDGCVPAWDFDAAGGGQPLDSSASAIAAAGLLELSRTAPALPNAAAYQRSALSALGTLARKGFTKRSTRNPGILQRQSHSVPDLRTEGSYAWGDAYFLLALQQSPAGRKLIRRTTTP